MLSVYIVYRTHKVMRRMVNELQWGLEYQILEYRTHWNSKHFKVWISKSSVLEWSVIAIAIAMVPTIPEPNQWKSKVDSSHFVQISNGFGQDGGHFVQNGTLLEN